MKPKSNRIEWLDIAKGYVMLLVMLGHMSVDFIKLPWWVGVCTVPIFFFFSGYVFSDKYGFKEFVTRKFKALVIPYLILGFPVYLVNVLTICLKEGYSTYTLVHEFCRFLYERKYMTFWYMTALFLTNLAFYIINKYFKKYVMAIVICLVIIGCIYYRTINIPLAWNADVVFISILFFGGGYYYRIYNIDDIIFSKRYRSIWVFIVLYITKYVCQSFSEKISGEQLSMFLMNTEWNG